VLRDDFSERINRVIRGFAVQSSAGTSTSGDSYLYKRSFTLPQIEGIKNYNDHNPLGKERHKSDEQTVDFPFHNRFNWWNQSEL
jgi:predicted chitinase